ncbi:MAG: ATP-binding protein, partial [Candidatus Methylumidiphilus sp.]
NAAGEQIAAFAAFPDITARKQGEAELNRARDAAEAASRAKSLFLTTVSHEIRTPLNAILGFAQVLQRDTGLSAAQQGHLATIQRSGEHLLRLIHDILDMAKIEAGRMEVQAQPFGLRQTLLEMEQLFLPKAQGKGLALSVEAAAGLPASVNGDETKLRQVLINLLGNAIKFTPAGAVSLQVEAAGAGRLLFRVTDTGLGIAAEEMPKLFLPFSQTSSGLKVREGTGLGLALCSQFVRLMGGELAVSSVAGHGTCFFFTLPLPAAAAMPPPARRKQPPVAGLAPGQPPCRILIADGRGDDRAPLRALLETLNPNPPVLQFLEAANPRAALDCLAAEPVDVLFISLGLLESAGVDARQPLLAQMAGPGLVVALAAPDASPPAGLFPPGLGVEFARKPIQADALFAILLRRTPLQFVRQADIAATAPAPLPKQALANQLAERPAAWLKELRAALDRGDSARISVLIEPLRDSDPGLHPILAKWAYDCDHEAFIEALDACGAPPSGQP